MSRIKKTNELEFQGQVVTWFNQELRRNPGIGLERATQEKPGGGKRNDLVVWRNRVNEDAFLEIELKTPETHITDPSLLADAISKAQRWGAPYLAIWNMVEAEIYRTPPAGSSVTPADALGTWKPDPDIHSVEDWLDAKKQPGLKTRALQILDRAVADHVVGDTAPLVIDPTVFVDRLTDVIGKLRNEAQGALTKVGAQRAVRKKLKAIAAEQGFIGFVDDIDAALAGQYSYRIVGQILFYFAFRRKQPALRPLELRLTDRVPESLRPYWDDVRRYDYEALFSQDPLDSIISLGPHAQRVIREFVADLAHYDWASLRDDVLGSIFEGLIPKREQHLLGQFYTPRPVADFLVSFALDGERPIVLDPGCGSGTFLLAAYDALADRTGLTHRELLPLVWGFDISPFATELAAINLFKQDFSEFSNFPRILPGDFFSRKPGDTVEFPPSKVGGLGKVPMPIPTFDAIVGNPPYLRSQNQDDLDAKYKDRLFSTAKALGVGAAAKTDLFLFFVYHALRFMHAGSRLAFVTPASWLTSDYAAPLQLLLSRELRLVAIVSSMAESFFTEVGVNTVLLIVEKREVSGIVPGEKLLFLTLRKRLTNLFPHDSRYWSKLIEFVDEVEMTEKSIEKVEYRAKIVDAISEYRPLEEGATGLLNWSKYLRAPLSFYEIFGEVA